MDKKTLSITSSTFKKTFVGEISEPFKIETGVKHRNRFDLYGIIET